MGKQKFRFKGMVPLMVGTWLAGTRPWVRNSPAQTALGEPFLGLEVFKLYQFPLAPGSVAARDCDVSWLLWDCAINCVLKGKSMIKMDMKEGPGTSLRILEEVHSQVFTDPAC